MSTPSAPQSANEGPQQLVLLSAEPDPLWRDPARTAEVDAILNSEPWRAHLEGRSAAAATPSAPSASDAEAPTIPVRAQRAAPPVAPRRPGQAFAQAASARATEWRDRVSHEATTRLQAFAGRAALYGDVLIEHGPWRGGRAVFAHAFRRGSGKNQPLLDLVDDVNQTRQEFLAQRGERPPVSETIGRAVGVVAMMSKRYAHVRWGELRDTAMNTVVPTVARLTPDRVKHTARRAAHWGAQQAVKFATGYQKGIAANTRLHDSRPGSSN